MPAAYVGIDITASGTDDHIESKRMSVVRSIAEEVAWCQGRLHVVAFAGSAAASQVVFDGRLVLDAPNKRVFARKVPDFVDETMSNISKSLADARARINPESSDIVAQFLLASEFAGQLEASGHGPFAYTVDILTDGLQSVGTVLNTETLTVQAATDLANTASPTTLPPHTTVKVSGIGRTAGTPAPTDFVEALKAFYTTYCTRTGANCSVVVDYTS